MLDAAVTEMTDRQAGPLFMDGAGDGRMPWDPGMDAGG